MKKGILSLIFTLFAAVASAQSAGGPFAISGVQCTPAITVTDRGQALADVNITGTLAVEFQMASRSGTFRPVTASDASDTTPAPATTASTSANYQANVGGAHQFRVCATSGAGSAVVYLGSAPGGGSSSGTTTLEGAELTVGAQPADNPHFVRCSNGTTAAPCEVVGPLTDAELRATPIEVTGDFTSDGLTDAQLRASPVPVLLPAGDFNIGNVDVVTLPSITVGTFPDNEPFNVAQVGGTAVSTGNGTVDAGTIRVTLPSNGTGVVGVTQATASNLNAQIVGNVAHDSPASGNPVQVAGYAASSAPTNVSVGDVVRPWFNLNGSLNFVQRDGSGNIVSGSGAAQQDETAFTPGTTPFTPIGGTLDDTAPDVIDEGEAGVARMTAYRAVHMNLRDSSGNEVQFSTDGTHDDVAPSAGPLGQCEFDDTSPDAIDEGDGGRIRCSANRNQYVTLRDAAGNERGLNIDANGRIGVTNGGTFATQIDGAALVALQLADDPIFVDDAAFTPGTSKVDVAGFAVDETATDSADEGDAVAVRATADRILYTMTAATTATAQQFSPCYIGGGTGTTASTNAANCKASAGVFYGFRFINTTSTLAYLRMYNASGSPTCSSSTGFIESIPIPSFNATDGDGGGLVVLSEIGIPYSTGIAYCITGGGANNDNTAAPAGVYGTLLVK